MLFVSLAQGQTGDTAEPVMASCDRRLIAAVLRELKRISTRDDAQTRADDAPSGGDPDDGVLK